ncbi:MAG: 16S rRNA (guanine(966)-N(2))-methyltransferase RsmD [Oscillospiraceae bacterium]
MIENRISLCGEKNMRVITGTARGRKLETLEGEDVIRPTADRVKEAMFSIVQFELENARVLDLFAGSGQLGIEALSRGAKIATFVDSDRNAIEVIKSNLKKTELFQNSVVLSADSFNFAARSKDEFDIILLDPPYNNDMVQKSLPLVSPLCSQNGIVICETDSKEELPKVADDLELIREYKYSNVKLTTYRKTQRGE